MFKFTDVATYMVSIEDENTKLHHYKKSRQYLNG